MKERRLLVLALGLFLLPLQLIADTLDNINVMALSPIDGQVVLQLPNKKMQVLKIGAQIDGTRATLSQVLVDKAVFEELIQGTDGEQAQETVWLHKVKNGVSRIERVSRQAPRALPRVLQQGTDVESRSGTAKTN